MTPLPAFSELQRSAERLTVAFELTPELGAFAGHFPATPILPAVVQMDWAIRIARANFPLPPRFSALRSLKFLRVVQPPVRLTLELAMGPGGRSISFTYTHGAAACSSGRIEFTDDAAGSDRSLL